MGMSMGRVAPRSYEALQKILSECSLDNRLYILSLMDDAHLSVADVRRKLMKAGIEKSFATVKRYLNSLRKIGLVDERNGRFRLTNLGFYVSTCFEEARENIDAIEMCSGALEGASISCLPPEFIHDLKVLKKAKYVADSFSLITELFLHIQNAEREIDLLAPRPSYPLFELIGNRVLEGVFYRGISGSEHTPTRVEYAREFIRKHNLEGERLKGFRERFLMREHEEVLIHAVIVDAKVAGINFPYRDGRPNMETAFVSSDPEFVRWVKEIMNHFWKESHPIEY